MDIFSRNRFGASIGHSAMGDQFSYLRRTTARADFDYRWNYYTEIAALGRKSIACRAWDGNLQRNQQPWLLRTIEPRGTGGNVCHITCLRNLECEDNIEDRKSIMKTTHRNYSEEQGDFQRLAHFFTQHPTNRRTLTTWCLGRFVDWKYGIYRNKRAFASFCEENGRVWLDGFGELAGCVLSESGDATFSILTFDGYRFLFEEMLQWAMETWKGRATPECNLSTELTEYQEWEIKILERYGFCPKVNFFTRRFDLTNDLVPRVPLEADFTIVDMKEHPDFRAQGILRANAFQNKSNLTEEELNERIKFFNYSMNGPLYHPDSDLYVMAPDGSFISGCEALINAPALEADIERVCTHSDFRKHGFARAVIQECLYRLKAMGIHNVYITGYSEAAIALYGSLGAMDEVKAFYYEIPA
jgi:GNAT superfamily N-acetyltransferase